MPARGLRAVQQTELARSASAQRPRAGILRHIQSITCFYYTPVFSPSVRPSIRPSGSPSVRPSVRHSFPHFSPTCFDILIWNFVYHFIFMHVRSSSNAINFRHFLQELCSFLTSNSYKYAVFRTFLLHALTYWAEILHMTLFYCTTDQVRVSSICVNFCGSYAPFGT